MAETCLFCGEKLKGRADKKFCDSSCRNSYNNEKNSNSNKVIYTVNRKLRRNRSILSELLPDNEEMKKVKRDYLLKKGFTFEYFTHIYRTQKGKEYYFIYDMGYLDLDDDWYLIVKRDSDKN